MIAVKTLFVIAVATTKMVMPGMPDMGKLPMMKDAGFNAPTRTLTMNLKSYEIVDKSSTAECAIPEGLKLGPKVKLSISLPQPISKSQQEDVDLESMQQMEAPKFVMKLYWGDHKTVPPGQPRIMDSSDMMGVASPNMMLQMQKNIEKIIREAEESSYAYWPGSDFKRFDNKATLPGEYKLTTNYCGGTSVTLDNAQDWLAPIEISGLKNVDLEESIEVQWKPVPNALGYALTAFAAKEGEMVSWTSSADPDNQGDFQSRALTAAEVESYLKSGIILPPTATSCSIPAGIFAGMNTPMLTMTAIGKDTIQTKDGIETHVTVRSTATVMLGGGFGGDSDFDDDAEYNDGSSDSGDGFQQEIEESLKDKVKNKLKGIFK